MRANLLAYAYSQDQTRKQAEHTANMIIALTELSPDLDDLAKEIISNIKLEVF